MVRWWWRPFLSLAINGNTVLDPPKIALSIFLNLLKCLVKVKINQILCSGEILPDVDQDYGEHYFANLEY